MIEYNDPDDGSSHNTLKISRVLEFLSGQQTYFETNEMFQRDYIYVLNLRYSSNLSTDFTGFYISNYVDRFNEKRYANTIFFPEKFLLNTVFF